MAFQEEVETARGVFHDTVKAPKTHDEFEKDRVAKGKSPTSATFECEALKAEPDRGRLTKSKNMVGCPAARKTSPTPRNSTLMVIIGSR